MKIKQMNEKSIQKLAHNFGLLSFAKMLDEDSRLEHIDAQSSFDSAQRAYDIALGDKKRCRNKTKLKTLKSTLNEMGAKQKKAKSSLNNALSNHDYTTSILEKINAEIKKSLLRFKIITKNNQLGEKANLINWKDNDGCTLLHHLTRATTTVMPLRGQQFSHYAIFKLFELAGSSIDVNIQDNDGNTPLHLAVIADEDIKTKSAKLDALYAGIQHSESHETLQDTIQNHDGHSALQCSAMLFPAKILHHSLSTSESSEGTPYPSGEDQYEAESENDIGSDYSFSTEDFEVSSTIESEYENLDDDEQRESRVSFSL